MFDDTKGYTDRIQYTHYSKSHIFEFVNIPMNVSFIQLGGELFRNCVYGLVHPN
jgi:hypothetical protein